MFVGVFFPHRIVFLLFVIFLSLLIFCSVFKTIPSYNIRTCQDGKEKKNLRSLFEWVYGRKTEPSLNGAECIDLYRKCSLTNLPRSRFLGYYAMRSPKI